LPVMMATPSWWSIAFAIRRASPKSPQRRGHLVAFLPLRASSVLRASEPRRYDPQWPVSPPTRLLLATQRSIVHANMRASDRRARRCTLTQVHPSTRTSTSGESSAIAPSRSPWLCGPCRFGSRPSPSMSTPTGCPKSTS
jgi:hypothetical protein